jgi:hypothetical protein
VAICETGAALRLETCVRCRAGTHGDRDAWLHLVRKQSPRSESTVAARLPVSNESGNARESAARGDEQKRVDVGGDREPRPGNIPFVVPALLAASPRRVPRRRNRLTLHADTPARSHNPPDACGLAAVRAIPSGA